MDAREYRGWIEFLSKNPLGDVRTQFLLAQLLSLISNYIRKKGSKVNSLFDFAPWFKDDVIDSDEQRQIEENKKQVAEQRRQLRAKFGR